MAKNSSILEHKKQQAKIKKIREYVSNEIKFFNNIQGFHVKLGKKVLTRVLSWPWHIFVGMSVLSW